MDVKNLLKKLSEVDINLFGRTSSEEDMVLSEEDRDKALQGTVENDRSSFRYERRVFNSLDGERFKVQEIRYFIPRIIKGEFPIKVTFREYNRERELVKKIVTDLFRIHTSESNYVFEA